MGICWWERHKINRRCDDWPSDNIIIIIAISFSLKIRRSHFPNLLWSIKKWSFDGARYKRVFEIVCKHFCCVSSSYSSLKCHLRGNPVPNWSLLDWAHNVKSLQAQLFICRLHKVTICFFKCSMCTFLCVFILQLLRFFLTAHGKRSFECETVVCSSRKSHISLGAIATLTYCRLYCINTPLMIITQMNCFFFSLSHLFNVAFSCGNRLNKIFFWIFNSSSSTQQSD